MIDGDGFPTVEMDNGRNEVRNNIHHRNYDDGDDDDDDGDFPGFDGEGHFDEKYYTPEAIEDQSQTNFKEGFNLGPVDEGNFPKITSEILEESGYNESIIEEFPMLTPVPGGHGGGFDWNQVKEPEPEPDKFPDDDPWESARNTEELQKKLGEFYTLPKVRLCPRCLFVCWAGSDGCKHTECGNPKCAKWFCHVCLNVEKGEHPGSWDCNFAYYLRERNPKSPKGRFKDNDAVFPIQTKENKHTWFVGTKAD